MRVYETLRLPIDPRFPKSPMLDCSTVYFYQVAQPLVSVRISVRFLEGSVNARGIERCFYSPLASGEDLV